MGKGSGEGYAIERAHGTDLNGASHTFQVRDNNPDHSPSTERYHGWSGGDAPHATRHEGSWFDRFLGGGEKGDAGSSDHEDYKMGND